VEGADAFAEEVDAARELSRARDLWQGKRPRDAARRLLKLVRPAGWGAAEVAFGTKTGVSPARWRKEIGEAPEEADRVGCRSFPPGRWPRTSPRRRTIWRPWSGRWSGAFPEDAPDPGGGITPPRHALVRLAQEKGAHLKRRAERRGRTIDTLDISPLVSDELGPLKKKLARDAEAELKNRLGDDLRLIASELRKLALHAGERAQITREDVEAVVAPCGRRSFSRWRKRWERGTPPRPSSSSLTSCAARRTLRRWRSRSWAGWRAPSARPGRQRPLRRIRGARAGLQRVPGQAVSCPRGGALREEAEGPASVRRVAGLQAVAEKAARILAPGAGALCGGGLRAEGWRRSAVVDGTPAGRGVRAVMVRLHSWS